LTTGYVIVETFQRYNRTSVCLIDQKCWRSLCWLFSWIARQPPLTWLTHSASSKKRLALPSPLFCARLELLQYECAVTTSAATSDASASDLMF